LISEPVAVGVTQKGLEVIALSRKLKVKTLMWSSCTDRGHSKR